MDPTLIDRREMEAAMDAAELATLNAAEWRREDDTFRFGFAVAGGGHVALALSEDAALLLARTVYDMIEGEV